jgi:hypothetical protein
MAIITGHNSNKYWQGCGKTGAIIYCCWECKLGQPLWKAVWRFLKKLDRSAIYPVILLLHIYPKELKTGNSRDTVR